MFFMIKNVIVTYSLLCAIFFSLSNTSQQPSAFLATAPDIFQSEEGPPNIR